MLNAKSLGLAGGVLWGGVMFLMTWLAVYTGYGYRFLILIEGLYPFYTVSIAGSFVGLIFGFIDGFVGLFLLAWLYNKFEKRG